MAQMAQFSSLQEARTTNQSLNTLMGMTSANQSLMLLGKEVKLNGSEGYGIVKRILFSQTEPPKVMVDINGAQLEKQLTDIMEVLS